MQRHILLVDDEEDTRFLLCDALSRKGYSVHAVESGQACLDWLRDHDVDIVITDLQMPGMSGHQLCEQLRDRHPHLLSIVLTGLGTYDAAIYIAS